MNNITNNTNNTNNEVKAIAFDIDGTLYSNTLMFISSPFTYVRNILWIIRFAKMRKKLRASILANDENDKLEVRLKNEFDRKSIRYFSEVVGVPPQESELLLQEKIYTAWIDAIAKVPVRYGMRVLLGNLRRNGYQLAILSDFQSQKKIKNWKLTEYFDVVICAEDYGVLKPDKRIFDLLCEKIDCKPQEVVFVGNHLSYDGIGSLQAGLHPFLFCKRIALKKELRKKITVFYTMMGLKKHLSQSGIDIG